eukprot:TRINITY_DN24630_c0_g1_i1.p1 TRINITY_DN24630_c0_g1~~TRINITY_DN24630_c0_g1_i1.p1  ORF type:complete len:127 (+),score=9.24 TRINITY_DN24630_c0_g1_i1:48-383(+)
MAEEPSPQLPGLPNTPPEDSFSSEDERQTFIDNGAKEKPPTAERARKWIKDIKKIDPRSLKVDIALKHGQTRPLNTDHYKRLLGNMIQHATLVRAVVWEGEGFLFCLKCPS